MIYLIVYTYDIIWLHMYMFRYAHGRYMFRYAHGTRQRFRWSGCLQSLGKVKPWRIPKLQFVWQPGVVHTTLAPADSANVHISTCLTWLCFCIKLAFFWTYALSSIPKGRSHFAASIDSGSCGLRFALLISEPAGPLGASRRFRQKSPITSRDLEIFRGRRLWLWRMVGQGQRQRLGGGITMLVLKYSLVTAWQLRSKHQYLASFWSYSYSSWTVKSVKVFSRSFGRYRFCAIDPIPGILVKVGYIVM